MLTLALQLEPNRDLNETIWFGVKPNKRKRCVLMGYVSR